jgi:hypothetical protein
MDLRGTFSAGEARKNHDRGAETLAFQKARFPGNSKDGKNCQLLYHLAIDAQDHVKDLKRADGTFPPVAWTGSTMDHFRAPGGAFDVIINWLVAQEFRCAYSRIMIASLAEITLDRADQLLGAESRGYVNGNVHVARPGVVSRGGGRASS